LSQVLSAAPKDYPRSKLKPRSLRLPEELETFFLADVLKAGFDQFAYSYSCLSSLA
jgi:hypothetical protein